MTLSNRASWAWVALAPIVILTDRSAAGANPDPRENDSSSHADGTSAQEAPPADPLPHGIHLARNGRYYQDACDHDAAFHCLARRELPASYRPGDALPQGNPTSKPIAGGMAPSDLLSAYSIPSSSSAGGAIVAIEDMPDPTALADMNVYRAQYGIPALPQCAGTPTGTSPCFAVVDENGNLNPSLGDGGAADLETSLDLDMISAVCPDCSILFVAFTNSPQQGPSNAEFITAAQTAQSLGAIATSISWGGAETGSDPTGYTQAGKMLVLAAIGDNGYLQEGGNDGGAGPAGGTPGYPASAPDVLAVGGTNLQVGAHGGYTEVTWNDASGATVSGCSTEFGMPAFQTNFLSSHPSAFGSCTMRAANDVSAAADFTPSGGAGEGGGIAQYSSTQGGWSSVVGTSAATPEMAAILVRLGLALQVSNDLGFVYENIGSFNDVTSGSNDSSGSCANPVMCTAGPGWDGPTGVGTPDGKQLASFGNGGGSGGDDGGTGGSGSGSSSGGGGTSSGGGDDAGAPNGDNPSGDVGWNPNGPAGCGCSTLGPRPSAGGAIAALGLALGFIVRRRRSRSGE